MSDPYLDALEQLDQMRSIVPLYKCTRPDGTDFYTGSVDYAAALASGEPLPELSGDVAFPGRGWYHLATVPTECVGMSWPCRLFEVEPVDDLGGDRPRHEHKVGATSVRVLAEVDAHVALGPQGVQVAALVERCATLTEDDMARLAAAWNATFAAAYRAASQAVSQAALQAAYRAAYRAAWAAARCADRDAAWDAALAAALAATLDATWDATWAARCAAMALLCRDLIAQAPGWDQDAYDLLTGPWRQVIGPIHPDDGVMR